MVETAIKTKAYGLVVFLATLSAHDMANFNALVEVSSLRKLKDMQHKAPQHAKLMAYYMVVAKAIRILRDGNAPEND